jgi:hypothetical protein
VLRMALVLHCGGRNSRAPGEQGPTRRTRERWTSALHRRQSFTDGREHGRTPLTLVVGEFLARPPHRYSCHRCEQPLRVVLPAHRLGDRAGRSPGSRVIACRPAFPVSQWLTRTKARRLQLRGQPRLHLFVSDDPCSLLPPRCDPRNQHDGNFPRLCASVKFGSPRTAPFTMH